MADRTLMTSDTAVLAALAHPLRRQLLDLLRVDGPATASTLAAASGQPVNNVSHHLRTMATAGLIEDAPDLVRDRRERWWRCSSPAVAWSAQDFGGDPASAAIELAAEALNIDRQMGYARAFRAASDEDRAWWADAPFSYDTWLRLTPAELAEYAAEVLRLQRKWADRPIPADGQERHTVFTFARGVPAHP